VKKLQPIKISSRTIDQKDEKILKESKIEPTEIKA